MSLLANHGVLQRTVTPPSFIAKAAANISGLSTTLVHDATPPDGALLYFVYRSTSGAPSTLPSGVTLLDDIDNNGLGIYTYTKTASSESNSYEFGDASTNEKSVIGLVITNYLTGASVLFTADSGAGSVGFVQMPSGAGNAHNYSAGTLIITAVVLLANRTILSRTPFDSAIEVPTDGAVGTVRTYAAFRSLTTNSNHQIDITWNAGTRYKAITIIVT